MPNKPRIGLIIGSTRKTRFADKPAQWLLGKAEAHGTFDVELLDLRDFDLPFFDEVASDAYAPTQDPKAKAWQDKLATFDGFIILTPEYNRSITGVLKNALDQAYVEWNRKPLAIMAYGSSGGARAVEHLRTIGVELQMVPLRHAVHIMGADFLKVHPMGENGPIEAIEGHLAHGLKAMFEELDWWLGATISQRAVEQKKAA